MNCKPGDLAIIVRPSRWSGWIVEVVSSAPPFVRHVAPDGVTFAAVSNCDYWLVKAPRAFGLMPNRVTRYGVFHKRCLRPILDPGDDAKDEMLRPLPADKALEVAHAMGDKSWD